MEKTLFYQLNYKQVFKKLSSNKNGLSSKEAKKRLDKNGYNKLPKEKAMGGLMLFLHQFKNPLIFILFAALIISYFADHKNDAIIIFLVIMITNTVGFLQEWKANKALKKLNSAVTHKVRVLRDGEVIITDRKNLVVGDIIEINSGDVIPADARIFESKNLKINEAPLTGESLPVSKKIEMIDRDVSLGDRNNMAFRGTIASDGQAKAIITATGKDTEIGQVAKLIKDTKEDLTPLQRQINKFGLRLGAFLVVANIALFFIGILSGRDPMEMFLISVVVVVSAVPEGLIPAMTIILAIGMQKLAKKKGLVRRAVAAETLGSVSVICADKTGTLTQGEMMVDNFISLTSKKKADKNSLALKIGILCNDALVENPGEKMDKLKVVGNPTDRAFLLAGASLGLYRREMEENVPRIDEVAFSSDIKMMATLHKVDSEEVIYVKGAPEKILSLAINIDEKGEVRKISKKDKDKFSKKIDKLTSSGSRVIAIAYKKKTNNGKKIEVDDVKNLTILGLFSLRDQVRPDVKGAIKSCRDAGIKVVIITGDHAKTAISIANEIGFKINNKKVVSGDDLDEMSEKDLENKVGTVQLYARVSPHHKLKIISALQNKGKVVAMTGDGINDSPALKKANIGVAVGNGTDVAKEVADLVLLDNSFLTIVEAVRQGRITFNNIQKVILYLFTDCFQEMVIIGSAILIGWPLPILPAQILWIKLIEDPLPASSLAFDGADEDVMKDKPRDKNQSFLPKNLQKVIAIYSVSMNFLALGIFYYYWKIIGDLDLARTVMFATIGLSTLFYIYAVRALKKSILKTSLFSNKYLLYATGLGILLLIASVYLPFLNNLLSTVPLSILDWMFALGYGIMSIIVFETAKWIAHWKEYNK